MPSWCLWFLKFQLYTTILYYSNISHFYLLHVRRIIVVERKVRGSDALHELNALRVAGGADHREAEVLPELRGSDSNLCSRITRSFESRIQYADAHLLITFSDSLYDINHLLKMEICDVRFNIHRRWPHAQVRSHLSSLAPYMKIACTVRTTEYWVGFLDSFKSTGSVNKESKKQKKNKCYPTSINT